MRQTAWFGLLFSTFFLWIAQPARAQTVSQETAILKMEIEGIDLEIEMARSVILNENGQFNEAARQFQDFKEKSNRTWGVEWGVKKPVYEVQFRAYQHYDQAAVRDAHTRLQAREGRRTEILNRLQELGIGQTELGKLQVSAINAEIKYCGQLIQQQSDRFDAAARDFGRRKEENNRSWAVSWGLRRPIYEVQFRGYEHYDADRVKQLQSRIQTLMDERTKILASLSPNAPCSVPVQK